MIKVGRIAGFLTIGAAVSAATFDNKILPQNRSSKAHTEAIYAALKVADASITYHQASLGTPAETQSFGEFKEFVAGCVPIEPFIKIPSFHTPGRVPTIPSDLVRWDCPNDGNYILEKAVTRNSLRLGGTSCDRGRPIR